MKNLYSRILEPKIIDDKFEGKHAIINMPDMRTMLECIYENKLFFERVGTKGSSRHEWTYGKHISGRENLKRALEFDLYSMSLSPKIKSLKAKAYHVSARGLSEMTAMT